MSKERSDLLTRISNIESMKQHVVKHCSYTSSNCCGAKLSKKYCKNIWNICWEINALGIMIPVNYIVEGKDSNGNRRINPLLYKQKPVCKECLTTYYVLKSRINFDKTERLEQLCLKRL